ncbi:MAG: carboxypeptidase-like regulatory domain-containing protein, partial [Ignavibacteriae bacterium]|nr:carboxypeptidase-like regulatory domain-containing protein [Ignavibacteriota bacterium]
MHGWNAKLTVVVGYVYQILDIVAGSLIHDRKMKPLVLSLIAIFIVNTGSLSAQGSISGKVSGRAVGKESGQPLPFTSITILGTQLGAMCNENGEFTVSSVPPGRYTVVGRLVGYEEWIQPDVIVEQGRITSITLLMVESAIPLEEVRITAERVKRQEDVRPSVLSVAPVRAKTLAGVGEDVLRTLQALPGVLAPNDFSSQLVIRGSGPDQNLIIMDDIEVFNPYRLYGIISMFNPETVTDISLMTGGFPAKYGDRLSAVLDVTNREGDKSSGMKGSLNASISNANLVLNGHSPFGINGSYMLSARRTYYDLILGPIAKNNGLVSGDVAFPNFTDFQTKLVFEPSPTNKIILNSIASRDGVDLIAGPERSEPDSVNVEDVTRNDVVGLAWHHFPSESFFSKLGVSWYRNSGETSFGGDFLDPSLNRTLYGNGGDTTGIRLFNVEFDSRYVFRKVSVKNEVSWFAENHTVEAGAGMDFLQTSIIWHFRPDETFRA